LNRCRIEASQEECLPPPSRSAYDGPNS
jgi:hypothetical protein